MYDFAIGITSISVSGCLWFLNNFRFSDCLFPDFYLPKYPALPLLCNWIRFKSSSWISLIMLLYGVFRLRSPYAAFSTSVESTGDVVPIISNFRTFWKKLSSAIFRDSIKLSGGSVRVKAVFPWTRWLFFRISLSFVVGIFNLSRTSCFFADTVVLGVLLCTMMLPSLYIVYELNLNVS